MAKPSYVKFEVSKEVVDKTLEAVRLAKQKGSVKKGINEVTKSIERNMAALVILAEDVTPEEVVMHIPTLCEQKKIPFVYVPTKVEVGNAVGINVPCSALAIEKAGEGESAMKEVIAKVTGKAPTQAHAAPAQQAAAPEKKEKPKKEKKEAPAPAPKPAA
ncbi:MAG: 50S ribosomal protein L7Ae [Candidatus Micrarchaeota archaeon]|nr:50S ribosomal protein L7Ae [Candidatus Micrarchaeota archaeon]